jgi:hypothetical protein
MSTNLLSLFNQDLHISDVYREVFKKLGLEFRGTYTIRQLIENGKERNLNITRIKGVDFDSSVDPVVYDMSNSDFEKRFFGGIMFDSDEKRKSYEEVVKMLDESFVLDEMELKNSKGNDNYLYIRGLSSKSDLKIMISRQEILVIKVPY